MRYSLTLLCFILVICSIRAQEPNVVTGTIISEREKEPLQNVLVSIEGMQTSIQTNKEGWFEIQGLSKGEYILNISKTDFITKRIPVVFNDTPINLNVVFLTRDIAIEQIDNLITLTDAELFDDEINASSSGLLQATRDVFLNRAAFDFGQAFFRVRGYDAQYGKVLINGLPMNKFHDGRPQWNNWGGLNDATRNQQFTHGLTPSELNFGSLLGTTNIDTRPSGLRPGTRLSSSVSNRTYANRLMITHTSAAQENGLTYSFSLSRRWAKQGYIEGTLYDAYSVFGVLEYSFDVKNRLNFTGILASNRRGRSSALTEEVFELAGKKYNPYWGEQNGKIRNSRERKIAEPILILNHFYKSEKLNFNTGIAYQFGDASKSRLGYYNAPNPDPTYYRYLPSFYVNSPIGANFESANSAKDGFLEDTQLNWSQIYQANSAAKAAYILYDDVIRDKQFTANTIGNLTMNDALGADFGVTYSLLSSDNYASINDLLGAEFHEDIDPFSNTLNDVSGMVLKRQDGIFNYHYNLKVSEITGFAQVRYNHKIWNASVSANYSGIQYQRNGRFQNERFLDNSLGKSQKVSFSNFGLKGAFTYKLNGRHWVIANALLLGKAPVIQNLFINPRESNEVVPNIQSEKMTSFDLNYYIRLPKLTGRVTGFYTRFQDITDVNFFFVESGVGSDFVQEVITDLDKLHQGFELGFEYQLSSSVQLTAVGAIGNYVFANNPSIAINFDTAGAEEELINQEGSIDLGTADIKNYKLAQGPQQAYAIGLNYRDPKYWWVGVTANYLARNYANISTITRTQSFYLDPETELSFPDATDENVNKLLAQNPLDKFYLLNLVGGKSWLKKGKYISIFASVNNVFDAVFRTGGYEQSRNGNFGELQQDNLSGTPSFAPKYWYGYGRTYFLNVAYSF